jgi:non-heme chloroperoxidase
VLVAAVPPLMLETDANPGGLPNRDPRRHPRRPAQGPLAVLPGRVRPFYGTNPPGPDISQGLRDWFWLLSMQVGFKTAYHCVKAFSKTDMTEDLKKIDVPGPDCPG